MYSSEATCPTPPKSVTQRLLSNLFPLEIGRKYSQIRLFQSAMSMIVVFAMTFASAGPAFAEGAVIGEGTRQVKPPLSSPGGVLTAGLRGGPQDGGGCNVPTDASHSPLFDSKPFTQHMLRFEEFGSTPLESNASNTGYSDPQNKKTGCSQDYDSTKPGYCSSLPQPSWAGPSQGGSYYGYGTIPNAALETMLGQPLYPYPTEYTNKNHPNPWEAAIVAEHTGPMQPLVAGDKYNTVADGRPPGPQFGHQRWNEFFPKVYTQTAQAGVRPNGGFRDSMQTHV